MHAARRETAILVIGDLFLLVFSLWAALTLRNLSFPSGIYFMDHLRGFVFVYAASLLVFYISGLYERQTHLVKRILGTRVVGAQVANTILAALLFFILPFEVAPKTVLVLYLLISIVLISTWRFLIVPIVSISHREKAVIVGEGKTVDDVLQMVHGNRRYYIRFISHIKPSEVSEGTIATHVTDAVSKGARLIVIDTRDEKVRAALPSLYDTMLAGSSFVEFSTFYEGLYDRVPFDHIDHAWLLESLPRSNVAYAIAKGAIDLLGSLIGSIIAAPFIVLAVITILIGGGGAPFIWHERIGKGNKTFHIIKLRTMLLNDHGDPELQKKNRVTRIGRVLRKTRIDELPQLWNILSGELSFIGPRPELPSIAAVYEKEIPYYEARHLITPGLSGWAQIHDYDAPRGAADIERTRTKLSYDLYYLKHRSFSLDIAIALKTVRALFSFSGT